MQTTSVRPQAWAVPLPTHSQDTRAENKWQHTVNAYSTEASEENSTGGMNILSPSEYMQLIPKAILMTASRLREFAPELSIINDTEQAAVEHAE